MTIKDFNKKLIETNKDIKKGEDLPNFFKS